MSRKNENETLIKNLSTAFSGTIEEGKVFMLGNIFSMLIDISKSLAVIADNKAEDAKPLTSWIKKPWGIVCSKCKSQAPFSPNGNQLESEFCPVCGSCKIKNTDPEIDKPDDLLTYYVTTCSNCGQVSPVGNYCIWCGAKDTCLGESGDHE